MLYLREKSDLSCFVKKNQNTLRAIKLASSCPYKLQAKILSHQSTHSEDLKHLTFNSTLCLGDRCVRVSIEDPESLRGK